jgi:hypothetical protein
MQTYKELNGKIVFLNIIKFIPIKTVKDTNSPPWIDEEVRFHIRKKYLALKKYRQCRTDYRNDVN